MDCISRLNPAASARTCMLTGCCPRATGTPACTGGEWIGAGAELAVPKCAYSAAREAPVALVVAVRAGCISTRRSLADDREAIIAFHLPGEVLHVTRGGQETTRHRAIGQSLICRLRIDAGSDPRVLESVLASAIAQIDRDERRILMLARKSSTERAAEFLLEMNERMHGRGSLARGVSLPMGRAEVADYLGLQPESVSRAFRALERARLIRRRHWPEIEFSDPAGLMRLAGFKPG